MTQQREGGASFLPLPPQLKPEGGDEQPIFLHSPPRCVPDASLLRNQKSTTFSTPTRARPSRVPEAAGLGEFQEPGSSVLLTGNTTASQLCLSCAYICTPAFLRLPLGRFWFRFHPHSLSSWSSEGNLSRGDESVTSHRHTAKQSHVDAEVEGKHLASVALA